MAEGKEKNIRKTRGKTKTTTRILATAPETDSQSRTELPIVGIGASAGGLEAFGAFFAAMPPDAGLAFVLIPHLDPNHDSIMSELIQKRTKMPVMQIKDGMQTEPDKVYVVPPNHTVSILNGTLQLMELCQPRSANLPIDSFFCALALDQGPKAVAIILSGTGSDGTMGIKAIKAESGMVMVQDEQSAKYDGMPRNAIATGLADFILPPDKMPEQLLKYLQQPILRQPTAPLPADEALLPDVLQKICSILRDRTGHDFSLYKKNTLLRRIERRMRIQQINEIREYVKYLQKSEMESDILFKELLIGVTSFFRDPKAFETLREKILPELLENTPDGATLRLWVTGCSSGEEAYSIAIILQETMEDLHRRINVQIFGTDIDEHAINIARSGLFSASITADVSEARLKRWFTQEDNHYRIKKSIREMVVFALQSIIKDPPFTKIDLLCCRNLLIYLGPELQQRLFPMFHYSLKPAGILFLGSSEAIGHASHLFTILDRKWKIYRRRTVSSTAHSLLEFRPPPILTENGKPGLAEPVNKVEELSAFQLVETILKQSDAPPCVIIDEASNIIYLHGRTGRYLEPPIGKISVNILDMARPGLKMELAGAIRAAASENKQIIRQGIAIEHDGGQATLDLTVKPLIGHTALRGLMMVVFKEIGMAEGKQDDKKPLRKKIKHPDVEMLEQELWHTRENLQATIDELATSNEELQSTNEELQSTNEELETSKEELQSLNEEAATVNTELQSRIDELSKTNDDMKNLLDSTQIATIFLDLELGVRRFTPKSVEIIPLSGIDLGRSINHFSTTLIDIDLASYAHDVIENLGMREQEVESKNGTCYRMRVRPYRTTNNVIDGVVITFEDITALKKTEAALNILNAKLALPKNQQTVAPKHDKHDNSPATD